MRDHFAYLMDDDSSDFFQELACESADRQIVPATATDQVIEKVAAVTGIQKLANRVARDIGIIKAAGESGYNFGAIQRGLNYIDGLVHRDQLNEEYGVDIFDKVASATIEHDLSIIHANLLKTAGEEYREWVDHTVSDIGLDLVKAAALEKEALIGLVRGAKAMHSAYKATRAAGLARGVAAKAALKAPARSFKAHRSSVAVAKRGKAADKLKRARGKAEMARGIQAGNLRKARSIKDTGVRQGVVQGAEQKAVSSAQKSRQKIQKAEQNLAKRDKKVQQRKAIEGIKPTPAKRTEAAKTVDNKTKANKATGEQGRSTAENKAAIAAKGSDDKTRSLRAGKDKKTTAMTAIEKEKAVAAGGDTLKSEATYGSSLAGLRDKGWAKLSPAEKNKVLQAGAGAYMAHQAVS